MRRCVFALALCCLALPVLWAQPPQAMISYAKLDNQAVLKMARDGIPEDAIIQEIQTHPGYFDLSAEAIASLKKAGVSERIIAAMRQGPNPSPKPESAAAPAAPPQPPVSRSAQAPVVKADLPPPPAPQTSSPPSAPARASTVPQPAPVPAVHETAPPSVTGQDRAPQPARNRQVRFTDEEAGHTPKAEVFGGFSITRSGAAQGNLTGWNAAVTGNINRWFGLVADVSKQSESQRFLVYDLGSSNVYLLLFGPQISFRSGRIHGFGRGLFGTSHTTLQTRRVDGWALTYGFGGGLDVVVASGFALRVLQWDAILRNTETGNRTDHRLSFGGVVRF